MSWIPGWDSIAGTGWWSGFYFWVSIACLIGLGIAEVASNRYSERKDNLASAEQREIQRRHDDDMARVQHDAAQANEKAAQLEKDAAFLIAQAAETEALAARGRSDAAKANERAAQLEKDAEQARKETAEARLEQERLKAQLAWRTLTPQAVTQLEGLLSQHPGKINVQNVANDPEALYLAIQFANLFAKAHWQVATLSESMPDILVFGLWVPPSPSPDTEIVRGALNSAHIGFSTDALPVPPVSTSMGSIINDAPILFVGSKPIPR